MSSDRTIEAFASAPNSERRHTYLRINGTTILDVDSYTDGFWVTTCHPDTLIGKVSTFYPARLNALTGVSGCRTPDMESDNMVAGADALAGALKWPSSHNDIFVIQSSGDLRGHVTPALVEQLELYGGHSISKIFSNEEGDNHEIGRAAFILIGRYRLGYGLGHQASCHDNDVQIQLVTFEDSWAGGRYLEGHLRKDCYATVDALLLSSGKQEDTMETRLNKV